MTPPTRIQDAVKICSKNRNVPWTEPKNTRKETRLAEGTRRRQGKYNASRENKGVALLEEDSKRRGKRRSRQGWRNRIARYRRKSANKCRSVATKCTKRLKNERNYTRRRRSRRRGIVRELRRLSSRSTNKRGGSERQIGRGRGMTNGNINKKTQIKQKSKNIRASYRKMRRLNLRHSSDSLDKGSKTSDQTIVTDTTQVLETRTRQEVGRIRSKSMRGRRTRTRGRERIGRRKEKTQASRERKLLGRKSESWAGRKTREPEARRGLRNTNKGALGSGRSSDGSRMQRKKGGIQSGSE